MPAIRHWELGILILALTPSRLFGFYTNQPADVVIGQATMNGSAANQGGAPAANTMIYPHAVFYDGQRLFVVEHNNHRIQIYNHIPTSNNASGDIVIGQATMTSNSGNQGGSPGANTLLSPSAVFSDGQKLVVADQANNRILIFNHIPAANNAAADVVVGQAAMTGNSANQGGAVGPNTLWKPWKVFLDGQQRLFIADRYNNRVLIFNHLPASNNAAADVVIGQPDLTSNGVNQGGGPGASTLSQPVHVIHDGQRLFAVDFNNHRVLIYHSIPGSNNAAADIVVGQENMTSNSANQGGNSPTACTLWNPSDLYFDNTRMVLTEFLNDRVLIFNHIPTSNNAAADAVLGQPDMTSNAVNQGGSPGARTLKRPVCGVPVGRRLIVADKENNRVLIYSQPLYLNAVSQDHGLSGAGITLQVTGTFTGTTPTVKLSSQTVEVPATQVAWQSPTRLSCQFQLHAFPGSYTLQAVQDDDTCSLAGKFLILDRMTGPGQWLQTSLGHMTTQAAGGAPTVVVADGDGDGLQEVYAACGTNKIYQFQATGAGQWSMSALPQQAYGVAAVAAADGDRDGQPEVYAAQGRQVTQLKYSEWQETNLGSSGDILCLAAGDANNDGRTEFYAACTDNKVYQYQFDQGAWSTSTLATIGTPISVAAGDGNGDHEYELYAADQDKKVRQFKTNGSAWTATEFPAITAVINSLAVGDGDNDGAPEVYGAGQDGQVYQFKLAGGNWAVNSLGSHASACTGIAVSDADQDGSEEVYASCADGQAVQFRKNSGQWETHLLGNAGTALNALAVGDGNNDQRLEIYAVGADNRVYQFRIAAAAAATTTAPPVPDHQIKAFQTRFNPEKQEHTVIRWYQSESEPATIRVYNLRGELIKTLVDHLPYAAGQEHEVIWEGVNANGSIVASGVYVVHIQAGNYQDTIKVAVIK